MVPLAVVDPLDKSHWYWYWYYHQLPSDMFRSLLSIRDADRLTAPCTPLHILSRPADNRLESVGLLLICTTPYMKIGRTPDHKLATRHAIWLFW